nr:metallophosphoesterase [Archangium primigenium]
MSWLHLSDLHMGPKGSPWLWPENQELFERDLRRLHGQTGPWDFVLISGNLTRTGSVREFSRVNAALESFWVYLRSLGSDPHLLVVPGIQDLHLANLSMKQRHLLRGDVWHASLAIQKDFWSQREHAARIALQQALSPFTSWSEAWRNTHDSANRLEWNPGLLPGDFVATFVKDGLRLGIAGLNSDFLLPDDAGKTHFAPTARQLDTVPGRALADWSRSNDFNLLMTHSPPALFHAKESAELQSELGSAPGGVVHLCGSWGGAPPWKLKTPPSQHERIIQAPSLFGDTDGLVPHGYIVGQLDPSADKRLELHLHPRALSSDGEEEHPLGAARTLRLKQRQPRGSDTFPPHAPPASALEPAPLSPPKPASSFSSAIHRLSSLTSRGEQILQFVWSHSGQELVFGVQQGELFFQPLEKPMPRWFNRAHGSPITAMCCSPDGRELVTYAAGTLRFSSTTNGRASREPVPVMTRAHVTSVAWSSQGQLAIGFDDGALRFVTEKGFESPEWIFKSGQRFAIRSITWSSNGRFLACAGMPPKQRVFLIDMQERATTYIAWVRDESPHALSMSWQPGSTQLAIVHGNEVVRIHDPLQQGRDRTLHGHTHDILCVSFSHDGRLLASKAENGTILLHRTDTWDIVATFGKPVPYPQVASSQLCFSSSDDVLASLAPDRGAINLWRIDTDALLGQHAPTQTVHTVSAKVVLVGEGRAGKTCLALRLCADRYEEQDSTHAMRIWSLPLERLVPEQAPSPAERREIILWDMGGQSEYRLVHQLFFRDTAAALMVMEPGRGKPARDEIEGWNQRFTAQAGTQLLPAKLLVGTKVDHEHAPEDRPAIHQLLGQCGFAPDAYIPTSAKTGQGMSQLRTQLARTIDWGSLARHSHPILFEQIQGYIRKLRESRRVVITLPDLERELRDTRPEAADPEALRAVVEQLGRQGMLADTRLADGTHALVLEIEQVERYANSLIVAARENLNGVPAINVADFSTARQLPRIRPKERLRRDQELMVLDCVVELLLQHGICLRHQGLLVFPSLFVHAPSESGVGPTHAASAAYEFSGPIENIYASLVAALATSRGFGAMRLWGDRAEFGEPGQDVSGLRKLQRADQQARGIARLELYFETSTPPARQALFTRFVTTHLQEQGVTFESHLAVQCPCGHIFAEQIVNQRRAKGLQDIVCSLCDQRTSLMAGAKNASLDRAIQGLQVGTQRQREQSVLETKVSIKEAQTEVPPSGPLRILHLSDLHVGAEVDPMTLFQPLVADLQDPEDLAVGKLDYLVISGDITNRASAGEFKKALEFVTALRDRFELSADRCIIVPGNHDLDWDTSVYDWRPQRQVDPKRLPAGSYKEQGAGYVVRDDKRYPERFRAFSEHFHHPLVLKEYPLDPEKQCIPTLFTDTRLQFLAMNSSWEVDEYFQERSHIHEGALSRGLLAAQTQLEQARRNGQLAPNEPVLKLAVWHHPITGNEKIQRDAFMGRLRQAGVRLVLHGHVHENRTDVLGYLDPKKQIYVIGAGSFGAPTHDRPESVPRLYNLIEVARDHSTVRVNIRALPQQEGAWEGWATRPGAKKGERRTYYDINLRQET